MFLSDTNRNERHKYQQKGFKQVQDVYEDVYDEKTGKLVTKKTDVNLFYEEIQEAKDSIYLPSILEKYKIDINKKALVEIDANVVDMTEMPQDMQSMFIFMKNQEIKFGKMPSTLQEQFGGNYLGYLNKVKSGEAQQIIDKYNNDIKIKKGLEIKPEQQPINESIKENVTNEQYTSL